MDTTKIVWREGHGSWIGYPQELFDYWSQGDTAKELEAYLRDLYVDLTSGELPGIRIPPVLDIAVELDELRSPKESERLPAIDRGATS